MLILPPAYYVYQSEGMQLLISLGGALVYSFILIFIYIKLSIKKNFGNKMVTQFLEKVYITTLPIYVKMFI